MADATTPCKTHHAVKWNCREKVSQTKFVQNLAVVFRKFLNTSDDNTGTVQFVNEAIKSISN